MIYLVRAKIEKSFLSIPQPQDGSIRWGIWCGNNSNIIDYFMVENDSNDSKIIYDKLKNYFLQKESEENYKNNAKPDNDAGKEKDIKYYLRAIYSIKPVIH